ncbi:MAG TPA: Tox-REase-5 domain-containing protein [Stellaceae bacterium]|nr:Tox-REase-5 domain-containing protein [Stellaceae bacterium]
MSTFNSAGARGPRGAKSKALPFVIDTEGNTVTHNRVFFRRTPVGYVCVALGPPAQFLRFAFDDEGGAPFFHACRQYARALESGAILPTQIPGGPFSLAKFDDAPLRRLAVAAALLKFGYDPNEPRDERGRWSEEDSHGGGASALFQRPGSLPESFPFRAPDPPSPSAPQAESLLETTSRLALRGLSLLLRRLSGPVAFLSTILIPTNRSLIQDGTVPDHPELSYHYDQGEGRLIIVRTDDDGKHVIYSGQFPRDDIFRDADGRAIGRIVDGGIVIDVDALPASNFKTDPGQPRPKLCPDPGLDQPGGLRGYRYQAYIGLLNNGFSLPPGLAMNLPDPETGKMVHFDDCRWSDGTMLEAKGSYAWALRLGPQSRPLANITKRFLDQARRQLNAAGTRSIEWYFEEAEMANFTRELFKDEGLNITVHFAPSPWGVE